MIIAYVVREGQLKMQEWKMRDQRSKTDRYDWKMGPNFRVGKCRTRKCGVENAGLENVRPVSPHELNFEKRKNVLRFIVLHLYFSYAAVY